MAAPLRIAVVGTGAFGRNHLRVLRDIEHASPNLTPPLSQTRQLPIQLTAAVEPNPDVRREISGRFNIPLFASVDDLLAADLHLQAATVAVPTRHHARVATQLLEAGLDVLIEKPLTTTLEEADALIALAEAKDRIIGAGHLERFNPAVTAALPRLTRPMFFEAHRLSVFTPRSLDVDVVLDLMIHDLDILLTMANSSVKEVRAVGLPVLSRKVDIANVRLEFRTGAVANLTASRISTEQVRKLRLFQPAQYLSLDYARQELLTINVDPNLAGQSHPQQAFSSSPQPEHSQNPPLNPEQFQRPSSRPEREMCSGEVPVSSGEKAETGTPGDPIRLGGEGTGQTHPSPGLTFEKLNLPRAEPLRLELQDFLEAVESRTQPRVTASAARTALAVALEINREIEAHTRRAGLTA